MIISLDNGWRSHLLFLPARESDGKLVGLEIIAHFTDAAGVRIPTELVISQLTAVQQRALFQEKLALLETCRIFFIQQQLIAWINVTPTIVEALLSDDKLSAQLARFPFLELTINERLTDPGALTPGHPLQRLAGKAALALADFGAGDAPAQAAFSGLFRRVMLDKNFVQRQFGTPAFTPFLRAIAAQVVSCGAVLTIAGIDNEPLRREAALCGAEAMSGALWPPVPVALLTSLVQEYP